jgi:hypothetical protein
MIDNTTTNKALDEVLAALHEELEDGAGRDRILKLADEHPEARDAILAFAAEWIMASGSDGSDDSDNVVYTIKAHDVLLDKFWRAAAATPVDTFAAVPAEDVQRISDACRIDPGILRKLARRLIDEGTVPGKLVGWLAAEIGTTTAAVWSSLSLTPAPATADYFAPDGRRNSPKSSFADAVRASTLAPEDRRFWLAHLDG